MKFRSVDQAFALIVAIITMASCQPEQKKMVLSGTIDGITDGKVILTQFRADEQIPDTADIVDGSFVLEKHFAEPTQVSLMVEDKQIPIYFYAENAEMTLTGHADSLYTGTITGGVVNEHERVYREGTRKFFEKYHMDSLYKAYSENRSDETMDEINAARELYDADVEVFQDQFITDHSDAYYAAILASRTTFGLSADEIEDIINKLDPKLHETDLIKDIIEEMEILRVTDVSVASFVNNVPDVDYRVDIGYPGRDHVQVKYLGTFPNDDICALKYDGTISVIDPDGKKIRNFETNMTSDPTALAVDPVTSNIYVFGTLFEEKEAKFRGKTYKQKIQIGVECMVYDAEGNKVKDLELADVKTSTGAKIVNGRLFLADYRSRKVAIFDLETGKYEASIDDARACCGILDFGVNSKNEILLANLGAFRVQAFDMEGNIQYSFGKRGRGINDFHGCCNPVNVSYMPNGAIITVEKDPTRIKVYTETGAHQVEGVQELVKGCSYIPMTTDSKNNVYLASVMSGLVKVSPAKSNP